MEGLTSSLEHITKVFEPPCLLMNELSWFFYFFLKNNETWQSNKKKILLIKFFFFFLGAGLSITMIDNKTKRFHHITWSLVTLNEQLRTTLNCRFWLSIEFLKNLIYILRDTYQNSDSPLKLPAHDLDLLSWLIYRNVQKPTRWESLSGYHFNHLWIPFGRNPKPGLIKFSSLFEYKTWFRKQKKKKNIKLD